MGKFGLEKTIHGNFFVMAASLVLDSYGLLIIFVKNCSRLKELQNHAQMFYHVQT